MNAKESPSASTSFNVPLSCFSVSFLLQHLFFASTPLFSFVLSIQRLFLSFFPPFAPLFFLSFSPTYLKASPKLVAAQKAHSISPIRACLSVKMKSNRLPQNQKGPAFHANSQAKKKKEKILPSTSIHPKPNILSSYFVSFI